MALGTGYIIYASELNSNNYGKVNGGGISAPGSGSWRYYPGTSGYYLWNLSVTAYFYTSTRSFQGGNVYLQKLENGSWVNAWSYSWGWNVSYSYTYYGSGNAYYRWYYEGKWNACTMNMYWARHPNYAGSLLKMYDIGSYAPLVKGTAINWAHLQNGQIGAF